FLIMPSIKKVIDIKAAPEKVFDLIARVEDFSKYSSLIKKVAAIGPKTYHWVVNIYGIEFEWDAKVIEAIKPKRFVWQSIKGAQNSGSYILESVNHGTRVTFSMEYHLSGAIVEKLAEVIAGGFMEKMVSEILENIKKELEKDLENS
ncbi:MAG: SRPBCC family protein, partial [Deltaproteobacteria bacterium]|nr:SRPBCC family protein [Deltaproteobacteria bacterium]